MVGTKRLEVGRGVPQPLWVRNPFCNFNNSPEVILSFPKTQSERGSVWLVACSESHERNRQRSLPRNQPWAQQSGRKLTLAVQATRTGDGEIPKPSHVTEIRRSSCFSSQPLQPRTPSLQPQVFQVQSLRPSTSGASFLRPEVRRMAGFWRPARFRLTPPA